MLILGTMEEESMMNTTYSRTDLRTVAETGRPPQALAATLPGMAVPFGMAAAGRDIIHNAAHDTRHATAFPCH